MFGGGVAGAFAGMAGVHIIIKVVDKATKQIHKIIKAMGGLQAVAGVAALMFGGAVIAMGIKRFAEFEDVMVDVQKTANLTKIELGYVTNQIRELARNSRMSHVELAKIAFVAGQMGIAKSQIVTFTKEIEMMSVALDLSGEETARTIGKIMAAFRMSGSELRSYIDLVNELSNQFVVTADEIIEAVLRAAPAAAQLGVPIERVSAMAAAIIKAGVSSDRAGTGIRRMFQYMVKNADVMSKAMGMSMEEFRAAVNENALAVIETFIKMAQESGDKFGVLAAVVEIFGMRASEGIGILSTAQEHYAETLAIATDKTKYAGSVQREYDQKMATTAAQFDLMKNALNDAMIVLGAEFAPALVHVTELLTKFAKYLPAIIRMVMALGFALIISKNAYILKFKAMLMNLKLVPLKIKALGMLRMGYTRLGIAIHTSMGKLGLLIIAFTVIASAVGYWTGALDLISLAFIALAVAIAIAKAAAGDVSGVINAAIAAAAMGVISLAFRADMEKIGVDYGGWDEEMKKDQAVIDALEGVEGELKTVDNTMKQVNARDMSISIPLYITFERETMEGMDKAEFEQFVYDIINKAIVDGLQEADLYEVVP